MFVYGDSQATFMTIQLHTPNAVSLAAFVSFLK